MPPDDLAGWGSEDRRESDLPVERRLDRLGWRVDSLYRWRKEIEQRLGATEEAVDNVTEAQKIAKAVATELSKVASPPADRVAQAVAERGTKLTLTWYQKAGAFVAGALLLADAVRGLVS